jgi:hypothetical protein
MRVAVSTEDLATFKRSWPCHNIPDDVSTIVFIFDWNTGDLVDVEAYDGNREVDIRAHEGAGASLVALSHTAREWARLRMRELVLTPAWAR